MDEPEQAKTETKPEQLKQVPEPVKAVTVTPKQLKAETRTVAAGTPRLAAADLPPAVGPLQEPVQ